MDKIKLDDIAKNTPFKVPDNYFEQLSADILERKSGLNQKSAWVWTPAMKLALASTFVLMITLTIVLRINFNSPDKFDEFLADVSTEDIVAYLASSDLNEFELLEAIDDETMLDFEIEDDFMQDLEIDDESLDDIFQDYGITDELLEI